MRIEAAGQGYSHRCPACARKPKLRNSDHRPQFECLPVQDCGAHTDVIYMTAVPATVILTDKQGDCYRLVIHIKSRRFRGAFNNLHFGENIPATGSFTDGNLELGYYQDPGFKAGDSFPLWSD
jgi:tRNA(Ile2) C34 agmatinyltransferase TiaS